MRNLFDAAELEPLGVFSVRVGHDGGHFRMWSVEAGRHLTIVASIGGKWDHVSVSLSDRCPTWAEMELVKRAFFHDDETAMQLHVKPDDHISLHPYCLHLWRPHGVAIPLPPKEYVA